MKTQDQMISDITTAIQTDENLMILLRTVVISNLPLQPLERILMMMQILGLSTE